MVGSAFGEGIVLGVVAAALLAPAAWAEQPFRLDSQIADRVGALDGQTGQPHVDDRDPLLAAAPVVDRPQRLSDCGGDVAVRGPARFHGATLRLTPSGRCSERRAGETERARRRR